MYCVCDLILPYANPSDDPSGRAFVLIFTASKAGLLMLIMLSIYDLIADLRPIIRCNVQAIVLTWS